MSGHGGVRGRHAPAREERGTLGAPRARGRRRVGASRARPAPRKALTDALEEPARTLATLNTLMTWMHHAARRDAHEWLGLAFFSEPRSENGRSECIHTRSFTDIERTR